MLFEIIEGAGWPIWPLIFVSIVGLSIVIERAWFLRERAILPEVLVDNALDMIERGSINKEELIELSKNSFLGDIFISILKNHDRSTEEMTSTVYQTAENIKYRLDMYLSGLSTISTIAPLLGLFGTIIGMVEVFGSFSSGGHDVSVFAKGISIALYNTAGGIVVAVPAMIAYRFFRSKVDHLLNKMEIYSSRLINALKN